jgi:hypothetical protein
LGSSILLLHLQPCPTEEQFDLPHAIVKEDSEVPDKDIDLALTYKDLFTIDPQIHTYLKPEEATDGSN